jgi:thiol-disulfide isomerase/thioredoxin
MALRTKEPGTIRFWSPLRIVSTLIVLGLIAAFGVSSCNSNDPPTASRTATSGADASGKPPLPAIALDTELKSVTGESIKLSNYSGKVLLVNLWATWCGPCRTEIPELVKLHKEYQSRGVEMVGLSTEDPVASAESVQEFVKYFKVDYQVGWAPREVAIALMQGRGSIPQSLIITRNGRIKKRFVGFHPQQTPPLLKQALEDALIDNG